MIIGLAFGAGYWAAYMRFDQKQVVFGAPKVTCDDKMVDKFNTLYLPLDKEDTEKAQSLIAEIKPIKSDDDPTCQTILFSLGVFTDDKQMATEAYAKVQKLYAQGKYANTRLMNTASVGNMGKQLQNMKD